MERASPRHRPSPPSPASAPSPASSSRLGSAPLVTVLAQLALLDAPETPPTFVDGLGRWLGWTDAAPLFEALNGPLDESLARKGRSFGPTLAQTVARVQAGLKKAIDDEARPPTQTKAGSARYGAPAALPDVDAATFRQRYSALQQAMGTALEPLRGQLRGELAARSPQATRLAMVDAVLARVLEGREQSLLSMMPLLAERHFERLRQAHTPPGEADQPAVRPTAAWLATFRKDMQRLLLAELEQRMQPLQGLLAALQAEPAATPSPRSDTH